MKKYPGLQEHKGVNGYYQLKRDGEDFVLDIYLRSVPSFMENGGVWVLVEPANREYPDISFVIDVDEDYLSVVSMEIHSFGMDGVNEFLVALLAHHESLNQVDELLPLIAMLLDQKDAVWGEMPVDLETELAAYKLGDMTRISQPGI